MGFEGYFKNVNCFTFLKTLALKEKRNMSREGDHEATGEEESHPVRE